MWPCTLRSLSREQELTKPEGVAQGGRSAVTWGRVTSGVTEELGVARGARNGGRVEQRGDWLGAGAVSSRASGPNKEAQRLSCDRGKRMTWLNMGVSMSNVKGDRVTELLRPTWKSLPRSLSPLPAPLTRPWQPPLPTRQGSMGLHS
jgi:hypothetical protein